MTQSILFFADRLPPLIGGMEMHAGSFIEHFTSHSRFPLHRVITKDEQGTDVWLMKDSSFKRSQEPAILFFNSGRWIEELEALRAQFPKAFFIYRTGGNEIIKASLTHKQIPEHPIRQSVWSKILNHSIDLLVTNSAYTENRLRSIGIQCPFARCIGGVTASLLQPQKKEGLTTIFCAARFVPYKNHSLLISVVQELVSRGYIFQVRLAGDGPLLAQTKNQVAKEGLSAIVHFLGALDNKDVCKEIANASLYIQLSLDQETEVPGGSYIHSEGMGRSILEALTAGTYIVAGRSGALPEVIGEGQGLLIDLEGASPQKIADLIEPLLQNLPQPSAYSDRFSWSNLFKHYEELMEGCLIR